MRAKLQMRARRRSTDPSYQENVAALEAVQPEDFTRPKSMRGSARLDSADGRSGALPNTARHRRHQSFVTHRSSAHGSSEGTIGARGTVANTTEWGTDRYSALELIQDALNLKTPTVYDPDPKRMDVI